MIGVDLGDKQSQLGVLGAEQEIRHEDRVRTTTPALEGWFSWVKPSRVVWEAGTHSPWVSRLLDQRGHGVSVADPRRLTLISQSDNRNDRADAGMLARVAAAMPELWKVVKTPGCGSAEGSDGDPGAGPTGRSATKLWCSWRGLSKSLGHRWTRRVSRKELGEWAELWEPLIAPWRTCASASPSRTRRLGSGSRSYPAAQRLEQIAGVGPLISLTFVRTLDDPRRFRKSRQNGELSGSAAAATGFRGTAAAVADDHSGGSVFGQSADSRSAIHFGPDTDLKRWGKGLAARGGKHAKKRAVVAVARKWAVLMHRLWGG